MNSSIVDRIPEDRIPAILARAAELDRDRRETITVEAIRNAALDAGISPAAVDAALEEYAAKASDAIAPETERREQRSWFDRTRGFFRNAAAALKTPLKLGGAFVLAGLTAVVGEPLVVIGCLAWLAVAILLVRKHRPARRAAPYVLGLVFMTCGFGAGLGIAGVDDDLIGILFSLALPLLAVGALVIKARLPRRFRRSRRRELEAHAG